MKESSLQEFRLFHIADKLVISQIGVSLKPESTYVAVERLDVVKELPSTLIF
jgi:hypothetical protein